jgi:hypothetical protein
MANSVPVSLQQSMDLELEWTMGAQCMAQRGAHYCADFCVAMDSNKMGVFSGGNFLTLG